AHAPVLGLGDLAAKPFDDARHLGGQLFDLLGARILKREKTMLIKRHGCPFLCWRGSRRQALRDLRKGLDNAQKAEARDDGTTGPATAITPKRNNALKVQLLRPSVQLPAGIHGCAGYKDFELGGKRCRWLPWEAPSHGCVPQQGYLSSFLSPLIYLFVYHTNNYERA